MKVSRSTVEHVANLARLNLTKQEIEKMTEEMGNVISYMDKLNELDTTDVIPKEHILPIKNVFRYDITEKSFKREEILANALKSEKSCFKVPKTVE